MYGRKERHQNYGINDQNNKYNKVPKIGTCPYSRQSKFMKIYPSNKTLHQKSIIIFSQIQALGEQHKLTHLSEHYTK